MYGTDAVHTVRNELYISHTCVVCSSVGEGRGRRQSCPILFWACRFSTLHFVLCVCSEVCHDFEEQDVAAEILEESCDVTSWLP